ncbi:transglycosylase [Roseiarcaceae bacterium H3SJ34-1]|uniref:transglycosylase n=1 Tax=Terripilifer ovatus TaxID=3032367 RepID=UPI003AB91E7D|nr:transglycosylase [Roseiarcaceae bacterium H3SJ34-1]
MPIVTSAILNLIVVLAIGIAVGLLFNRFGISWLRRKTAGATGVGDSTYALVGIAGSFIGYHVAVILGLLPTPLTLFLAAIVGAVLTVWLWQKR